MKMTRRKRREEREKRGRICDAASRKIGLLMSRVMGRPCIVCGGPGTGIGDGFVYCRQHWSEAFHAKHVGSNADDYSDCRPEK